MLVSRTVNGNQELIEVIEGSVIKEGNAGTNTGGSPNFQDLTANAFTGVLPGDAVYISGILAPFTVLSVTNDNNIVLTTNITPPHTANATWRIKRGGIGTSALQWDPTPDSLSANRWHLFYNSANFVVR